jgi:long-chain acyl-CoA synthetase
LNLADFLARSAAVFARRSALVCGETRMSWAELDAAASRCAQGLRARGIGRGERVALCCPNIPAFLVAYYAVLKLGAILVPINILLKSGEIAYHLRDCGARALVCFEGGAELPLGAEGRAAFAMVEDCTLLVMVPADAETAAEADAGVGAETTLARLSAGQPDRFETVDCAPDDTAVILYTSGTTGTPKGAELSHSNLMMNALAAAALVRLCSDDVSLLALPLFHSFGQSVQMNASAACGAAMVLLPRFEPEAALRAMAVHGVTVFCGVPTMYIALLNHDWRGPDIAASLRVGVSGGAAMPVAVLRGFEQRYGVIILEGYGLSETSPVATFNHPEMQRQPGSIGVPITGVEVGLMDAEGRLLGDDTDGEIVVRGHNLMKGYWRRPEATAQAIRDGWFHTGDIGRRDADGNFYIVDRLKDMVIRGGFNVYPRELEEVLMQHPAVAMVAVIGVPHAMHGEEIKAFVLPKTGAKVDAEEIIAWCRERVAAYKYPRIVEIVESMPLTATGKILKRALRDCSRSSPMPLPRQP